MTSYCPQTRFANDPLRRWNGGEAIRYATPEEAQASLDDFIRRRGELIDPPDDPVETRIFESRHKPTHVWRFDKNGDEARGIKNKRRKFSRYR